MRPALRVTVSAHHSSADVQRLADALKGARVPASAAAAKAADSASAAADAPQNSARKRKSTSTRA